MITFHNECQEAQVDDFASNHHFGFNLYVEMFQCSLSCIQLDQVESTSEWETHTFIAE